MVGEEFPEEVDRRTGVERRPRQDLLSIGEFEPNRDSPKD
jgi:hypothetical protein